MPACALRGCNNRSSRKSWEQLTREQSQRISFHTFPKNKELLKKWLEFVNIEGWQPVKGSSLCSDHFDESSFDKTSLCCVRLREGTIPTILSCPASSSVDPLAINIEDFSNAQIHDDDDDDDDNRNQPKLLFSTSTSTDPLDVVECQLSRPISKKPKLLVSKSTSTEPKLFISTSTSTDPMNIGECQISRSNSPVREVLMREMKQTKKMYSAKVKRLQQMKRRHEKCIASLKHVIKCLKKKFALSEEYLDSLKKQSLQVQQSENIKETIELQ